MMYGRTSKPDPYAEEIDMTPTGAVAVFAIAAVSFLTAFALGYLGGALGWF
jgi:hypothetical protein